MAGMVARTIAGPGVVLSFLIAAVASIFSGKLNTHRILMKKKAIIYCFIFLCLQVLVMPNLAFVCHTHRAPHTCIRM